ncbi:MAG: NAD-dependent deacylase [Candidatus Aenigmarchaeota archaeon]|nr:NAD-dependent deacylase [Candidatus Aenigmarchaeota archaeon]
MKNLIERAARDLINSSYAVALTGAGISTESGIPDFRGPSGIWTKDPEAEKRAYQTYHKFLTNPKEYWEERLARPLLGDLGKVEPNPGHYALAELEKMGILKWVITQNIDNLHQKAGNKNVLDYHGNYSKLRCRNCGNRFDSKGYNLEKLKEEGKLPPLCPVCTEPLKADVVHFNEPIPLDVAKQSREEVLKCDLMLICGTSAVVYPFAELPRIAKERRVETESKTESGLYLVKKISATTIIEINAEPTPLTYERISDYLIQGKTGEILPKIVEEVKIHSL